MAAEPIRTGLFVYWGPLTGMSQSEVVPTYALIGQVGPDGVSRDPRYEVQEMFGVPVVGATEQLLYAEVSRVAAQFTVHIQKLGSFEFAALIGDQMKTSPGLHVPGNAPGLYGRLRIQGYKHSTSRKIQFDHFCLATADPMDFKASAFTDARITFRSIYSTLNNDVVDSL